MELKGWNVETVNNFKPKRLIRNRYTKPCDGCSAKKIKCDQKNPCTRCTNDAIPCTNNRGRRSLIRDQKHEIPFRKIEVGENTKSSSKIYLGTKEEVLSLNELLPFIKIYKNWYYGNWPVLPMNQIISRIRQLDPGPQTTLNDDNILCYSLCCAVGAAISNQLTFVSVSSPLADGIIKGADEYAKEAIRVRHLLDYRLVPSTDNLLTSFFLYIYYVNVEGGMQAGLLYMKEAINIAQLLKLHSPETYEKIINSKEIHTLRKIYYMLLVSERFMCIEEDVPVCLEPSIPLPILEDEDYPISLLSFIELVKTFSIPDRKFFDNLSYYKANSSFYDKNIVKPNVKWIVNVQNKLVKIETTHGPNETQILNVILSKHWMRSLAWHIAFQNNLISRESDPSLEKSYPVVIAKEFLADVEQLSPFAFESNGPGTCFKLLEIASSVADSITDSNNAIDNGFSVLNSMFELASRFKSNITISQNLYSRIERIVMSRKLQYPIDQSYVKELDSRYPSPSQNILSAPAFEEFNYDTGFDIPSIVQSPNSLVKSPLSQIRMAFTDFPIFDYNFDRRISFEDRKEESEKSDN